MREGFNLNENNRIFIRSCLFILISSVGGFLLSLTEFSLAWMIGTLTTATLLSYLRPKWLNLSPIKKGVPKYWLNIGMFILGIELGLKINLAVLVTFQDNWFIILCTLVLSILFSLLTGYLLWKFSPLPMMTSFISTTPGGLSVMSAIADEVGANTAVVSIVQTMRVFLVVFTIPFFLSTLGSSTYSTMSNSADVAVFEPHTILWTIILLVVGVGGSYGGKLLRIPAPWLVGTMIAVALVQAESAMIIQHNFVAWWPHFIIIFAQVLIGASIGSRIHKEMFIGLKHIILLSFAGTVGLITVMLLCSYFVSKLTGISYITAALAFAPGGISEMSTAALIFGADATFVVAVQTLRVIFVCVLLPPLYKFFIRRTNTKKETVA